MRWETAKCGKNKYCDFTKTYEDDKGFAETCIFCGRRVVYLKKDGKTDNVKYLRMHVRNFAQPYGATRKVFEEIYGKQKLMKFDRDLDKAKYRLAPKSHEYREKRHKDIMDFYDATGKTSF